MSRSIFCASPCFIDKLIIKLASVSDQFHLQNIQQRLPKLQLKMLGIIFECIGYINLHLVETT